MTGAVRGPGVAPAAVRPPRELVGPALYPEAGKADVGERVTIWRYVRRLYYEVSAGNPEWPGDKVPDEGAALILPRSVGRMSYSFKDIDYWPRRWR